MNCIANRLLRTLKAPSFAHPFSTPQPVSFPFSTSKKPKQSQKQQKSKQKKSYNINIDQKTLPAHLKKVYAIKKQTDNLEVVSESRVENLVIIEEIRRQRADLEREERGKEEKEEKAEERKEEDQMEIASLTAFNYIERSLKIITGVNVGLTGFFSLPVLSNNFYWLGVYSSCFLYPSLLFTACASIGINLGYLIVRQGLQMHTPIQSLTSLDLTKSPLTYYLQMSLLALQFTSLALTMSLPITLMALTGQARDIGIAVAMVSLLAVNAHSTYQERNFGKRSRMAGQALCFAVMFLLSSYVYVTYSSSQPEQEKQQERQIKFKEGRDWVKTMWKVQKTVLEKDEKITDILEKELVAAQQQESTEKPKKKGLIW